MADQQQDEERARVRAPVAAVFVASDGTCATHDASPAAVVPEVLPEVKGEGEEEEEEARGLLLLTTALSQSPR